MSQSLSIFIFGIAAAAFLAGLYGERWRARRSRRRWLSSRPNNPGLKAVPSKRPGDAIMDSTDQLRLVMDSKFNRRPLMSKSEARIFYIVEEAVAGLKRGWRVMAQVSLGEILASPDPRAYSTINSKRVDILLISSSGDPLAAIEYQGSGHYQGTAPARDAVKKEALRKAGVRHVEVTPEQSAEDLAREISRIASAQPPKTAPRG